MESRLSLIPKQAYLLFPEGRQVCFQQKNIVKRMIFGENGYPEYTQIQNVKIAEFTQLLRADSRTKQILDQNQRTLLLKMIYANKYNLQKALQNYKDYKAWQRKFLPREKIDPQYRLQMDQLLKTGVFYCCASRDQFMKPMIVVHVGRLLRVKPQEKLFLDTFGYFLQTIIDTMMIDGQLETWNVIVDVDQTSVFSFAGVLFDLIKFLSRIFIGRMYRCYIVDYPFLIKFVWGTVALMMDAEQNQKCKILTRKQMLKLIPKEALQEKYGGDLPTLQDFWPLDSPQRLKIQHQSQISMRKYWVSQNKLFSQKEYYKKYLEGKIGNKKCLQITAFFQNENQVSMVKQQTNKIIVQTEKLQKLADEEKKALNEIIKRQREPIRLKILKKSIFFNEPSSNVQTENKSDSINNSNHKNSFTQAEKSQSYETIQTCIVPEAVFKQLTYQILFLGQKPCQIE